MPRPWLRAGGRLDEPLGPHCQEPSDGGGLGAPSRAGLVREGLLGRWGVELRGIRPKSVSLGQSIHECPGVKDSGTVAGRLRVTCPRVEGSNAQADSICLV